MSAPSAPLTEPELLRREPVRILADPSLHTPEIGYFSLPSTRWDIIKFLCVPVISVAWALIVMWFAQVAQAQNQGTTDGKIAQFQAAKEIRIEQIAVIQTTQAAQAKDIADIKRGQERIEDLLLARLPR
ncbi:MAG: hypothetical protein H8F28_18295 [Fibrella sp.]|nr:hypothetical protein [Armatimonadota bacterium]